MQIDCNGRSYEWIEDWARIPDTPRGRENGRTHGVAVSKTGQVVVFNQADPAVLLFNPDGTLAASWGDRFGGAHGLTLVEDDGVEHLWLTDQGTAEVVKTTLDGRTVANIERAPHPAYGEGKYSPTWVAVNETRHGGNGDVWVADGYGSSLVHRYTPDGEYVATLDGSEGAAGAFKCPHGIWFDSRKDDPELYIADRGNSRVQVYDGEGRFKRAFDAGVLNSPCMFDRSGDELLVPELRARVTILDADDKPVCQIGLNDAICTADGWPNERAHLKPGLFNSPHAMTADAAGNLFIVEWITGGRITKLQRVG